MAKALTIIFSFFWTVAFAQLPKSSMRSRAIYQNVDGLTPVDSVSWQDIVGGFYISNGFCGYNFRLDSNMRFQKIDFCCVGRFKVDSGTWTISDRNTAVLKSDKLTLSFDIVKFDDFYFFILPSQRQKFIDDLKATKVKLKNVKPIIIGNRTYSAHYLIGYSLIEKYYAKEIGGNTGI